MSSTVEKLGFFSGAILLMVTGLSAYISHTRYDPSVEAEACSALRSADILMNGLEDYIYLRDAKPTQAMVSSLPPMEESLRNFLPELRGEFRVYISQQADAIARTYEELKHSEKIFVTVGGIDSYIRTYNENRLFFCVDSD